MPGAERPSACFTNAAWIRCGFWITTRACVLDCNQAAVELLGADSKEALLGRHPVEVSPAWQADGIRSEDRAAVLVALAQSQGGARFEWELKRFDGTLVPVEVVSTRIPMGGRRRVLRGLA